MRVRSERTHDWRDPLAVATGLRNSPGILALISGSNGEAGRSWVGADPDCVIQGAAADDALFDDLRQPGFETGVVGLLSYDAGARTATGPRQTDWPDLMLARYPALLMFDPSAQRVTALGWGDDDESADAARSVAESWLGKAVEPPDPAPPANTFTPEATGRAYRDAVGDVVARIAAGDLFQANIARAWSGVLEQAADPFDLFLRLNRDRASAYGAFWRLGDRAVVSNSPELFLTFDAEGRLEARPIKGTRPRDPDAVHDAALAADLASSAKDRAENLMIVDLMRNDLARVARPGSVKVDRLFEIQTLPTLHHLVSTVVAQARDDVGPADVLEATFPPGSITGAPTYQAMKVIAQHEPARGPWCGSLFILDQDGALTASVLIRTVSFTAGPDGWRWRTLAGAGIVADSDPVAELAETEAKIAAIRTAMVGDQGV